MELRKSEDNNTEIDKTKKIYNKFRHNFSKKKKRRSGKDLILQKVLSNI